MKTRIVEDIRFVEIPGGQFYVGLEEPIRLFEGIYRQERARHRVGVNAFWMSIYPITNQQFERWMPQHVRSISSSGNDSPVVDITWYEATAFCRNYGFRLPTENEWERAATGTKTLRFSYGNKPDVTKANVFPVHGRAVSVGDYEPNEFGVHQLSGNVYELTADLIGVGSEYVA
jgi:formylglycine-generating enzyme required for sulfatase activity